MPTGWVFNSIGRYVTTNATEPVDVKIIGSSLPTLEMPTHTEPLALTHEGRPNRQTRSRRSPTSRKHDANKP